MCFDELTNVVNMVAVHYYREQYFAQATERSRSRLGLAAAEFSAT